MKDCAKECAKNDKRCPVKKCRYWINYKKDLNCAFITVFKNGNLTLHETAKRLNISYVRVSQIEKSAISKLRKKALLL